VAFRVTWSESALTSLTEAIGFIARDSPSYAAALAVQAERAGTSLEELAERGRPVPEFKDAAVPEIPWVRVTG
jgi:plasmid stabilization system protein ParE